MFFYEIKMQCFIVECETSSELYIIFTYIYLSGNVFYLCGFCEHHELVIWKTLVH